MVPHSEQKLKLFPDASGCGLRVGGWEVLELGCLVYGPNKNLTFFVPENGGAPQNKEIPIGNHYFYLCFRVHVSFRGVVLCGLTGGVHFFGHLPGRSKMEQFREEEKVSYNHIPRAKGY